MENWFYLSIEHTPYADNGRCERSHQILTIHELIFKNFIFKFVHTYLDIYVQKSNICTTV